jgi:hypothetical protein
LTIGLVNAKARQPSFKAIMRTIRNVMNKIAAIVLEIFIMQRNEGS